MQILETERLILRELDSAVDAEFVLELLNSPGFIKYIGDRGVRDLGQACDFIENRFRKSYRDNSYGLWAVEVKANIEEAAPLGGGVSACGATGICGFVKRVGLPDADIGFAFLPQHERKGYGFESASAVMRFGRETLGFGRVLAITSLDNDGSGRLLEKLGFTFNSLISLPHDNEELKLYVCDPPM